jgi:WD40 repeat protein/serine/threonine protein kinase/tetratricopeptide (TPR) repeat protein
MTQESRDPKVVSDETLEIEPAAQKTYFDQSSAGEPEPRQQAEALQATCLDAGSSGETTAPDRAPIQVQPRYERVGSVIGPYRLLEQIGEGGMGAVFLAEQTKPIQRTVALKIIKPGMDSRQIIARFEAEEQALALMDHAHIARVLDAGTTDSGRPYFVMELVDGLPITRFCDEHRLSLRERLELFVPVCQAVQHAHQKGVIHRDLKPSNVLVAQSDGKPVPKVIDFGVAKAIGPKLTERTLATEFGSIVGTLEYMSPEQAGLEQLDIDTRSDIYSLGVILYELITGSTPLGRQRVREAAILEQLRMIREEEPLRPSNFVSRTGALPSIAARRGIEPRQLSVLLRGELDWIVMKALEKDRNRRYETANGLALDLLRYLRDEPVQACPPSASYRFRKLARRHRAALTTVVLVGLALLAGTAVSTWQAIRAVHAREEADRARQKAVQALYFADIQLAQQAQKAGNFAQADESLDRHLPGPSQPDVRGWEWHYLQGLKGQLLKLRGHRAPVRAVWWSPDSRRIASASSDQTAIVWDSSKGEALHTWNGGKEPIQFLAWSPDGRMVAGVDAKGAIQLWEPANGQPITLGRHLFGSVRALAWNPRGGQLASAANNGTVHLWDVPGRRLLKMLTGQSASVNTLAWSPDGERLASGGSDATLLVWEPGRAGSAPTFRGRNQWGALALAWSPDSHRLAVSGFRVVSVWDVDAQRPVSVFPPLNWTHISIVLGAVNSVAWSPDGRQIATASGETTTVWDASTAEKLYTLHFGEGDVRGLAWSPDAGSLLATNQDGTMAVLNLPGGQDALTLHGHAKAVRGASWSPDSRRIVSASYDNTARIWDAATGKELFTLHGHASSVQWATWSPDSRRVATASKDGTIKLWDASTGNETRTMRGPTGPLYRVSWHPEGKLLAASCDVATVWVCDTTTGKEAFRDARAALGSGLVEWTSWSPNGRWLASASANGLIKISDAMGKEVRSWLPSLGPIQQAQPAVYCVAWSPDNTRLASSGRGSGVRLWDARTGSELLSLRGHTDLVYCICWSPDGRRLASASFDRTIKLWDADTGHEVLTLHGHDDRLWSVAWSPDGQRLASASDDGTIRIWGVPSPTMENSAVHADALVRAWHREQALSSPDWPGAIFHLRRLVERDPGDHSIVNEIGNAWEAKGRPDQVIAVYREVIRLQPDSATAYSHLGGALERDGVLEEAVAAYKEAIRLEPEFDWHHYTLGRALRKLGRLDEAIAELRKAGQLKPTGYGAPAELGLALAEQGRLDDAITAYRESLGIAPGQPSVHGYLGLALSRKQMTKEAIAAFEAALRLDPGSALAQHQLARLLATCPELRFRDPQRAVALAQSAVKLAPKNGEFQNTLGMALYRAGRWKEAIAALETATDLRTAGNVRDGLFLAMAHWQLGDREAARTWYEKAMRWMQKDKSSDEELDRFRAEAADLMGLPSQSMP